VVCVLGPRQSGKSTLAQRLAPRYAYVSFDDPATLAFAQADSVTSEPISLGRTANVDRFPIHWWEIPDRASMSRDVTYMRDFPVTDRPNSASGHSDNR